MLFELGRLEEARAQAETVLELATAFQLGDYGNAIAGIVLFKIALHAGDQRLLDTVRPIVERMAAGPSVTRAGTWTLALEAHNSGAPELARGRSQLALDSLDDAVPSMTTPADFADDVFLASICAQVGDDKSVRKVAEVTRARADSQPGNPYLAAISLAVAGFNSRSSNDLLSAATMLRGGPRPLLLAQVLEHANTFITDDVGGRAALEEALVLYEAAGAHRDASRVLRSLRARGVRRRPTAPTTSPLGLTFREQQVLDLLATGATTQQISESLLLSPHTVVTHIRHIYDKLGVRTRREIIAKFGAESTTTQIV
mgnify:FL=1